MTYQTSHNVIRTRFNTQWGSTTPIAWPNTEFTPPAGDAPWVRFTIEDADSFQASMGAVANIYRHPGLIIVNIFTPLNRGDAVALQYVDQVSAIFRSWRDASTRLRFKEPQVRRIGPDEKWYHTSVSVPFERDTAF